VPQLLDHIDLRVRDRVAATAFYDAFLGALGANKREDDVFTTWRLPVERGAAPSDNFGICEEPELVPGAVRVAFRAPSRDAVDRVAHVLAALGTALEWDEGIYGSGYYGIFFEDPDGNRLEVCVNG